MKALLIKHKWLFISAALVLALLLVAVWYLLVAVGEFNAAKKDLHAVSSIRSVAKPEPVSFAGECYPG